MSLLLTFGVPFSFDSSFDMSVLQAKAEFHKALKKEAAGAKQLNTEALGKKLKAIAAIHLDQGVVRSVMMREGRVAMENNLLLLCRMNCDALLELLMGCLRVILKGWRKDQD